MATEHVLLVLLLLLKNCLETSLQELPSLERVLLNNGFHRDLSTVIRIPLSYFSQTDIHCYSICIEFFPSNVFVDTFQLNSVGKHLGLRYKSPTLNIEKPQYQSDSFNMTVYSDVHISTNSAIINVTIPVHLRYHKPDTDYKEFTIINPDLLIHCQNADYLGETLRVEHLPCTSDDELLCDWSVLKYKAVSNSIPITVPVGNKGHTTIVVLGTLLVTFGSCLWIIVKIVYTKIKQS